MDHVTFMSELNRATWSTYGVRYMQELGPSTHFLSLLLFYFFGQVLSYHFFTTLGKGVSGMCRQSFDSGVYARIREANFFKRFGVHEPCISRDAGGGACRIPAEFVAQRD